jgi:hypothetical protein
LEDTSSSASVTHGRTKSVCSSWVLTLLREEFQCFFLYQETSQEEVQFGQIRSKNEAIGSLLPPVCPGALAEMPAFKSPGIQMAVLLSGAET